MTNDGLTAEMLSRTIMSESTVSVTVKLFVVYQEAHGVSELKLQFPVGATLVDVCDRLIALTIARVFDIILYTKMQSLLPYSSPSATSGSPKTFNHG